MSPSDLLSLLSTYSFAINRFLNKVLGVQTYMELNAEMIASLKAQIEEGVPDPDGTYIDRYLKRSLSGGGLKILFAISDFIMK